MTGQGEGQILSSHAPAPMPYEKQRRDNICDPRHKATFRDQPNEARVSAIAVPVTVDDEGAWLP